MTPPREPGPPRDRVPVSEEHLRLGRLLREARQAAGATTRDVAYYSSGHISNVENGHVMPSSELVYFYVTEFGCDEHLARRALAEAREVSEERRRSQRMQQRNQHRRALPLTLTPDSPADSIRSGYEVRETEAFYRLDERGAISEVDVIRVISPLYPGVSLVSLTYNYHRDAEPGDPDRHTAGVLDLQPGLGCRIAAMRETRFGYLSAVVRLGRELDPRKDETYAFSYRVKVDSDIPCQPFLRYKARPGRRRYALRVLFTPPALPRKVWWFRERDLFETERDEPAHPDNLFAENPSGFYFQNFSGVDEFHSGISWRW
ncbi:hypothetical protein GCM10023224_40650 [Streptomonospora halophila]|uniref:Helix-turn-helix domain-containing protein n=1 Tax=Streptomonospora halophila TaxID=427369 RepID=A0ABP9GZ11_9ACTN